MRYLLAHKRKKPAVEGFTLIEMLIIAPIVILTISAFIALMVSLVGNVMISRNRSTFVYNIQDSLDLIEQDTHLTAQFQTSSGTLPSPQGVNDGTGAFTNTNALILSGFATDKNPADTTRQLIYYANQPNPCGANQKLNRVFLVQTIYYLKNGSLWRRTVLPAYNTNATPDANTVCSAPWQRNSCSPGYTSPSLCQASDMEVLKDVANFTVTYYAAMGDTTPLPTNQADQASAITVTIDGQTSTAGKPIAESGSITAKKSNGPNTQTPQSSIPVVTASMTDVNTATFTWTQTPSATGYLLSYSVNGSPLTNASVGSTTSSYMLTVNRGDIITFNVAAQSSAGTSPYGSTTLAVPIWATYALQSGWTDYGSGFSTHGFTRTNQGVVVLKGTLAGGSITQGAVIGVLPPGYRPSAQLLFSASTNNAGNTANQSARIDIRPTGEIIVMSANNSYLSLDGINFMPSGTSWTDLPLYNGWTNWGSPHANIQSMTDSLGRVHVQGLGNQGNYADNVQIAQLPAGQQPSLYMHIAGRGAGFNAIGLNNSGGIVAKGVNGNTYSTTQTMFYPGNQGVWTSLSLINGWVAYDPSIFTAPQYTKASDGVVTLRGLIKGGGTALGTTIAILPPGYRPGERLIMPVDSLADYGRVDISPGGEVIFIQGSNGWLSLDNITFRAE